MATITGDVVGAAGHALDSTVTAATSAVVNAPLTGTTTWPFEERRTRGTSGCHP